MSIGYGDQTVYNSVSEITGPTGWYMVNVSGHPQKLYINQDYDGGGWVLVLANRRYTAGMNRLTFNEAMNGVNYRHGGSDDYRNSRGLASNSPSLADFNAWVGLNYWSELSGRKTASTITVVQYMAATNGVSLTGTHTERIRFSGTSIGANGAMAGVSLIGLDVDTNAWGNSGFYSMISNPLTTYDNDQDTNSGNCATYYNNNPFWYTSCWTGNIFAGGSYIDGPYWVSSTSTYSQQYCGVYIK